MNFYTNVEISGNYILYRGIENGNKVKRKEKFAPLQEPNSVPNS
jgi:hypothetical protein